MLVPIHSHTPTFFKRMEILVPEVELYMYLEGFMREVVCANLFILEEISEKTLLEIRLETL